ncbi:recombinase family protein [Symbiopectobacterium purcellii]|uniref:recombinase family protein n=1 Tax=Symbiopectobacterium purcellii TaxID=2871826 RepID=UPI003F84B2A5
MSRVFAYCRVSTADQTTENQKLEIQSAGFAIEPHRFVMETISGSTSATRRPEFMRLLDRLESQDVLVVTKLDRLGRNAMDVRSTVELLETRGVKVHCLALGGVDLTSAAGKMTMQVLSAVAEFERDLLVERTQAGLARARKEGKRAGRPPAFTPEQKNVVLQKIQAGTPIAQIAREFGVTRQSVMRVRQALTPTRENSECR